MSKNSNSNQNGPEETWDPLIFLSPNSLKEVIETKKNKSFVFDKKFEEMKLNGDEEHSIDSKQKFFLKVDCVNEASGSSYIEIGNAKVLCSVYGE
jgi:hypothetical protein